MKKYIFANWKENKTVSEALAWLEEFARSFKPAEDLSRVVLGVAFPLLYPLKEARARLGLGLKLGSQDVSRFPGGSYTGEVAARQLQGLADFVILGHSERKRYLKETLAEVREKVLLCAENELTPLLFLAGQAEFNQLVPGLPALEKLLLVFEPSTAISEGGAFHPADPQTVGSTLALWKRGTANKFPVLYGGSVNQENIDSYLQEDSVDGVGSGQASLDVASFTALVKKTLKYETAS